MGDISRSLDQFVLDYPFVGSITASLVAALIFALGQKIVKNSDWFTSSSAPSESDDSFLRQSDRAIRLAADPGQIAGEEPSRKWVVYALLTAAVVALGWYVSWRAPVSLPMFFYGIIFLLASMVILIEEHYAEGISAFFFGASLFLGALGLLLDNGTAAGAAFLAFGVATLTQAIGAVTGFAFGVNLGSLAEELGATEYSRYAGALGMLAYAFGGVGWGISFLIDASDKGGFGLIGIGFGLVAASIVGLMEMSPREEIKELQRPKPKIASGSMAVLSFGVAAISWAVSILSDSATALYVALLLAGVAFCARGIEAVMSRATIGVAWIGVGVGCMVLAFARLVDQTWAPILVALCVVASVALGSILTLWAERMKLDEFAASLGGLEVTLIVKDDSKGLNGVVAWNRGWEALVTQRALQLKAEDERVPIEQRRRVFQEAIIAPAEGRGLGVAGTESSPSRDGE